ncbi:inosine-5'-monophosphate dehydrogenase [Histoplasma mississippiense (nom. inval.)]|uniref:inosine-5'-monophosphate dehydrogenase n=1 Tax=Ajellomyces capsulatus (strain NAm1 / WU24) TaxID=2059318 RepID=UPI000157C119|nr:inosine-5'-monophosphate dehydrogenase [Histoplasma mississippiense (nom. inval.)]EDN07985.1 inosine-5'-monophosphate dehydrogenase [Histoplasma mississippiense (nom. inval.)]
MPISNGDASGSAYERFSGNSAFLDHTKALEVLKNDYAGDGLDINQLIDSEKRGALTYNDFLILPGYIGFPASDVSLETPVTRRITLKAPLLSSPMDTVTEHSMAIHMALLGGLGVIHHNCSAEDQANMVRKVKRYENGFILEPVVLSPTTTVAEAKALKEKWGFGGFPVTENGTLPSKLIGMITSRDIQFHPTGEDPVPAVMTTDLLTAPSGTTLAEANEVRSHEEPSLPYLASKLPHSKQLICAAAICTRPEDKERLPKLIEAGLDIVILDSSQGNSIYQIEMIKYRTKQLPLLPQVRMVSVLVWAAEVLASHKKLWPSGDPRLQLCAVYPNLLHASESPVLRMAVFRILAHIVKGLAMGATTVMMGGLLAGTTESPGSYFVSREGQLVKAYRGMGSIDAMEDKKAGGGKGGQANNAGTARYFSESDRLLVAQGVSGSVLDRGSVTKFVPYLMAGIQHSLQDIGVKSLKELHDGVAAGTVRFEVRSVSAQAEGGVHGLHSFDKKLYS